MDHIIESKVPDYAGSMRIDRYLAERFTYFSRTRWQREIHEGRLHLNGTGIDSVHCRVKAGDVIQYQGSGMAEPPVDSDFEIIYEDDDFLGVNKSGDLPVHPAGSYFNNTLFMLLKERGFENLHPIHRIDRETSGVIVFAKSGSIASLMQESLTSAEKKYLVVVHGRSPENNFTVHTPIGISEKSPIRKKREAFEGAPEKAGTIFRTLSIFSDYSLLEAVLETGRLHQIRVHLESIGLPVVGDKMYGLDETCYLDFIKGRKLDTIRERLHFDRSLLHAHIISFLHPRSGDKITITAPMRSDMEFFIREKDPGFSVI